jgi:hypothetical protein
MYCQFTLLSIEGQNYDSAPHGADAEVITSGWWQPHNT